MTHLQRGQRAEHIACRALIEAGYRIAEQNYKSPRFEIDIIAWDDDELVFVEVRSRRVGSMVHPLETLTHAKKRRLLHGALHYMQQHRLGEQSARFDFVAVHWEGESFTVQIIPNAFSF